MWWGTCAAILFVTILSIGHAEIQSPPRIMKQPPTDELLFQVATQQNENDRPFIIECEAEGVPEPVYRWIKNGKPFEYQVYDNRMSQQPGRGTLVITTPRDEDLGQYQCFATNEWGTATSNSVFVRKAELNSFKDEPPVDMTANEGEPFKLTCQPPDGWPKPLVNWLIQSSDGGIKSINNSRMTLDPEGNLWFSNVTRQDASDDFTYACAATSLFRTEYKVGNKVFLNVVATGAASAQNKHPPVKQYVSRRNFVATMGKKAELYCIYGGTPLPQTVWSKGGTPIRLSDRMTQGHYGKSLIIKHVTFDDEGDYTCFVSNGVGEALSYSINVKVLAAPYFTVEPEIINAAEGETVTFRCEASGEPLPQIQWIHNGKPVGEATPNPRRKVSPNSITIEKLDKTDTGNYGCNATNSIGYVYKDVYINVLALAPEITEPPKEVEETVNDRNVTLTCRVFGAPKPQVKWIRKKMQLTGGRYIIQENGDLTIKDVNFLDAEVYTCYAENKFGNVEASGRLVVKEHTRITDEPEDYEVRAGSTATFRCNAVTDPSLQLSIDWLNRGQPIDFEVDSRFVKSSDYSLIITKTTELDSGDYTCVASTSLDEARAEASLIVQDVPNAPKLVEVKCNQMDASLRWLPQGDNRAPILKFIIQYNTSFTPDTWEVAYEDVPATDMTYSIAMSPWANYTFRVIARNKIGLSQPSLHSDACTTQPSVPFKNPDNVVGRGNRPDNLVISWTPMPQIEHNAEGFRYVIYWKENILGRNWQTEEVLDWRRNSLLIPNQQTFREYRIKVVAVNKKGEANVAPKEVVGYSGEDVPQEAPLNFTLVEVTSATDALLSWQAVNPESVRGHFKGYKVQTWSESDDSIRETQIKNDATRSLIRTFTPHSKNFARVFVYNEGYNGPYSELTPFDTPEGVPGPVYKFEASPMGSSALWLQWKKPEKPNGILTGYKIYYQNIKGTKVGPLMERQPQIIDSTQLRAKLANLEPGAKYRVHIRATTNAGEGEDYFIETKTRASSPSPPDVPRFQWRRVPTKNGYSAVRVDWEPNLEGRSGSHFFLKYRLRGETTWAETEPESAEDYTLVRGLTPNEVYDFKMVAVDGEYMTESLVQEVDTYYVDGPMITPKENVATAGWFIGMMLAIAFLLLVLIIVCIIKRNRGGKYVVHERENAYGRHNYPEEPGFHEYSQPLDKTHGRASMSSDQKQPPESDTDSMAEYGEGDTEGMNEDGSFIGQYGKQRKLPGETTSGGFATLV